LLVGSYTESYCAAFENTGNKTNPVWTRKPEWDLTGLPTLQHKKPALVDLDGDGDYDLMVGMGNVTNPATSKIWAYQNTGNLTWPVWTRNTAWDIPLPGMTWIRPAFAFSTPPVHNVNTGLNYATIQAAIDAPETLDGHTLICDAGNYTENVHVHKSLNITAAIWKEKIGATLIIPFEPNDTFYIAANNVTIEGFTIQSVSGYGVSAYKADNCSILNNIFTGSGSGILLRSSNDNTVSGNEIDSLPGDGILLTDSSQGNEIVRNSLNRNHYGIQVRNASNYNVIADNFVNSSTWAGIKLNWQGSNYAPVAFNNITNNIICYNYDGIFLDDPSNNNLVSDNMVSDNYRNGIGLRQANNTTVVHNTVISNSYRGISAESSYANAIDDNFLNNTNNAWDNGVNRWNTTKQTGPNIIGGPYMGGNYWSHNPSPVDTNNDGIADAPYNITGGANKDYLPLVTSLPIFIASFVTPEGEPYPADDFIVSNGTWRRGFTNMTHVVSQVPYNSTYALTYEYNEDYCYVPFLIPFEPNDTKLFYFYAVDPHQVIPLTPYIIMVESDITAINQTWGYNSTTGVFYCNTTTNPPGKLVLTDVWTDTSLGKPPYNMISELLINGTDITPGNYYNITGQYPGGNPPIPQDILSDRGPPYGPNYAGTSIPTLEACEMYARSLESTVIGVGAVMHNGCCIGPFDLELQNLNGTIYDPEYLFPAFHVSDDAEGNYVLKVLPPPLDYCSLSLPIDAVTGDYNLFDVYVPKLSELAPYTFNTAAEFFPNTSGWSSLNQNATNKTLSVNVQDQLSSPWWGYFVLPNDRMVRTLTAYSGSTSYPLSKLYNYTQQISGSYTIVVVRIPPEISSLNCTYTVFGDLTGGTSNPWDFVPDGKVDGKDITIVALCYGSAPGCSPPYVWNANSDVNYDFKVDGKDIALVALHYGQADP